MKRIKKIEDCIGKTINSIFCSEGKIGILAIRFTDDSFIYIEGSSDDPYCGVEFSFNETKYLDEVKKDLGFPSEGAS